MSPGRFARHGGYLGDVGRAHFYPLAEVIGLDLVGGDALLVLLVDVLHVPPEYELVSVIESPIQTLEAPVIVPATGIVLIEIIFVVVAEPQVLVTVY